MADLHGIVAAVAASTLPVSLTPYLLWCVKVIAGIGKEEASGILLIATA